jgi:hypothetical protein
MVQQPKGKKKDRKDVGRKQAPKAPPQAARELSEEDLKKVAGGIELQSYQSAGGGGAGKC